VLFACRKNRAELSFTGEEIFRPLLLFFTSGAVMYYLYQYVYAYPALALALGAFTAWMLYDVHRRRGDHYWMWVILGIPLVGPLAYFFMVVAPQLQQSGWGSLFQRRASLEELRYRAEQMPTLANHLELAERLMEKEEYAPAVPHLEAALKREPDHNRALFCLALCHTRLGRAEQALPLVEQIIKREPRWSNYDAWQVLIEARQRLGDADGALEGCRELVRVSPTLQNRCLLAEHLLDRGQAEEARTVLERALQDHSYNPGPIRRRNRRWAAVARRLQKRAASVERGPTAR
jgi:hypothetical protein